MDGRTESMVYIRKSYKILIGISEGESSFERHEQGGRKKFYVCFKNHRKILISLIG
jgi:hypothetical protein